MPRPKTPPDDARTLDALPGAATWEWEPESDHVRYSAGVADLLGVEPGALAPTRQAWLSRVARDDLPGLVEAVGAALARGERWSARYRVVRPDGRHIEILEHGFVARRKERVVSALGVFTTPEPSERARAPASIPMNEDQFRTMGDWLPQLAWTAGPDGWLDWYNKRWYDYTGTTFAQMEGWGWISVHDPNDLPRMLRIWRNAHVTGQPWEDEFRLRRADGMMRWHLSRAMPYRDASGRVVRWFGTNTDIHDQKLSAEEYARLLTREQRARRQAEAANKAKDEFLATVSHELRTPLGAVLGWAELLRGDKLDAAKRTKAVEKILSNARHQAALIEDLLDVSRIITGKLTFDRTVIDVGAAVRAAVDALAPTAATKGVTLTVSDTSGGATAHGNAERIRQITSNLVGNAIKFTPAGKGILVTVSRAAQGIELLVVDEGEGVSPELLPHLFERFRQADSSSTRRYAGLGLGLSIVRELVSLHGGEVFAASDGVGRGARFTVRLPAIREGEPMASLPASESRGEVVSLSGIEVLGVDDDLDARDVLAEILIACGATVRMVSSVPEALRAFKLSVPDVVVSDIAMPEVDGHALAKRIRALPDTTAQRTPLIALSAHASHEDRDLALRAGFDHHLAKPVDPARLSTLIAAVVARRVVGSR